MSLGKPISATHQSLIKFAATVVVAALLLFAVPARAQDAHGAIAIGQTAYGEDVAYGFAWNYASRDEARKAALSECLSAGGTNCVELAWFQNGCGALAVDRYGSAQGKFAMSAEKAEMRALRSCEAAGGSGCAVVGSQCASQGGQAGTSGSGSVLADSEKRRSRTAEGTPDKDRPGKTGEPRDEPLTREERIRVQRGLTALGFDPGLADGFSGPKTRAAIRAWQKAKGYDEARRTGRLTREQANALAMVGERDRRKKEEFKREARETRIRAEAKRKAREKTERERALRESRERIVEERERKVKEARIKEAEAKRKARERAERARRAKQARERAKTGQCNKSGLPSRVTCGIAR